MKPQYITDKRGKRVSVILPMRDFKKMIEGLEELDDIKAFDRAKARKADFVPFEQAKRELAALRNE
jgi:hypothetical protein